ncbi:MAG: acyl phosphate:glycerol-3-phosphate acyltransferase [Clostridia bacterium]|nr:Acyl-phosphate:glycerol-3-phosphate O-acyltransferase PlsY [Clostridiales bacterium]MDK2984605.1 acyl phosphate:glycerol-3-phosphate acyltransferase [Clostridia bacterium]
MKSLLVILVGYFLGSIPSALIVGKVLAGIDIREHGSGNLGATNTFRILGPKAGTIVITADILKGAIPTYLGLSLGGVPLALLAGVAAIFGHSFPLFAGFRGGKGIATGAGVYLIIMPLALLIAVGVFLTVLFTTSYVSLSSMLAAITLLILSFVFKKGLLINLITLAVAAFVIYRHRSNIKRLWNGTENKARIRIWK